MSDFKLLINGNDETEFLKSGTFEINKSLTSNNSASFVLNRVAGEGGSSIQAGLEVEIFNEDGKKIFGGVIDTFGATKDIKRYKKISVNCLGYSERLDNRILNAIYYEEDLKSILVNILEEKIPEENISLGSVPEDATIEEIKFNLETVSSALDSIAERTATHWTLDVNRELNFFDDEGSGTAQKLDDSLNVEPEEFRQTREGFRNRQYLRMSRDGSKETLGEKVFNHIQGNSFSLRRRIVEQGADSAIIGRAYGRDQNGARSIIDDMGINTETAKTERYGTAREDFVTQVGFTNIELDQPMYFVKDVKFIVNDVFEDSSVKTRGDLRIAYPNSTDVNIMNWFATGINYQNGDRQIFQPELPYDVLAFPSTNSIILNLETIDISGNNSYIEIDYASEGNITSVVQDASSITRRDEFEPGSGVYAKIKEVNKPISSDSLNEFGRDLIKRNNTFRPSINYSDYRKGREVGNTQQVSLDKFGIDRELIIDSITIRDEEVNESQTPSNNVGNGTLKREVGLVDKSKLRTDLDFYEDDDDFEKSQRREAIFVPDNQPVQNNDSISDSAIINSIEVEGEESDASVESDEGAITGASESSGQTPKRQGSDPQSSSSSTFTIQKSTLENQLGIKELGDEKKDKLKNDLEYRLKNFAYMTKVSGKFDIGLVYDMNAELFGILRGYRNFLDYFIENDPRAFFSLFDYYGEGRNYLTKLPCDSEGFLKSTITDYCEIEPIIGAISEDEEILAVNGLGFDHEFDLMTDDDDGDDLRELNTHQNVVDIIESYADDGIEVEYSPPYQDVFIDDRIEFFDDGTQILKAPRDLAFEDPDFELAYNHAIEIKINFTLEDTWEAPDY